MTNGASWSAPKPRLPTAIAGLENFSLSRDEDEEEKPQREVDADSFFNLPDSGDDEDEDDR